MYHYSLDNAQFYELLAVLYGQSGPLGRSRHHSAVVTGPDRYPAGPSLTDALHGSQPVTLQLNPTGCTPTDFGRIKNTTEK